MQLAPAIAMDGCYFARRPGPGLCPTGKAIHPRLAGWILRQGRWQHGIPAARGRSVAIVLPLPSIVFTQDFVAQTVHAPPFLGVRLEFLSALIVCHAPPPENAFTIAAIAWLLRSSAPSAHALANTLSRSIVRAL